MNGRDLLEAMSYVEDSLVAESNQAPPAQWRKWAALAACLCVIVLGILPWTLPKLSGSAALTMENAAADTAAQASATEAFMAAPTEAAAPEAPAADSSITTGSGMTEDNGGITFCALVQPGTPTEDGIRAVILEVYRDDLPFSPGEEVLLIPMEGCSVPDGQGPWRILILDWNTESGTLTVEQIEE